MQITLPSGQPLDLRPRPLCLELSNTVGDHASARPREFLNGYADLAAWAGRAGVLSEAEAARLSEAAGQRPGAARAVYRRAITLREAVYRVMVAHINGNRPSGGDVEIISDECAGAMVGLRLQPGPAGQTLSWPPPGDQLDALLWPVAVSAVDLLTTPELMARLGQCADADGCGWLFIDLTKNHSRRWCAMGDCGNRAKARRYYRRQKRV